MNELAWLAGSRIAGDDTRLPRKLAKGQIERLRYGVEEGGGSGSSQREAVRAKQVRERLSRVGNTARKKEPTLNI